jgi:hypothetical protein
VRAPSWLDGKSVSKVDLLVCSLVCSGQCEPELKQHGVNNVSVWSHQSRCMVARAPAPPPSSAWLCIAGSLFEDSARRFMPALVIAHLIVSLTTVGINVWGTVLLYHLGTVCDGEWQPSKTFTVLVWMTWVILVIFFLVVVVPLQVAPSRNAGYGSWHCRWTCIALVCCCRRCVAGPVCTLVPTMAAWGTAAAIAHARSLQTCLAVLSMSASCVHTAYGEVQHFPLHCVLFLCRQLTSAPEGEQQPLERLSALFHQFFRHADFTSSDVAVTIYLANVLKRLERRKAIIALMSTADANANGSSGSSATMQELLPHEDTSQGTHGLGLC